MCVHTHVDMYFDIRTHKHAHARTHTNGIFINQMLKIINAKINKINNNLKRLRK